MSSALNHIDCCVVHCNSMLGKINITNVQECQRLFYLRLTLLALFIYTNGGISLIILRLANLTVTLGLFFKL